MLDLYADTPPLETLMEVPLDVRRNQLFKVTYNNNNNNNNNNHNNNNNNDNNNNHFI